MRVLFVSSEVAPFSKTGGLADVAGALPAGLRSLGVEVRTVTPLYSSVDRSELVATGPVTEVPVGIHRFDARWWRHPETDTWLVDIPALFSRPTIYTDGGDEHVRFAALAVAALALCRDESWQPDVVHCNDWQTGLVPSMLRQPDGPWASSAATVFTIHNLGYQGWFDGHAIEELGLGGVLPALDPGPDGRFSFLAAGIRSADLVTTVSPTYAEEIMTPEGGAGLDSLLRAKGVTGILNGIDDVEWNPRTDRRIPFRYSKSSLYRKEWDKRALLERLGLDYHKGVPVVGMVTRLAHQKGIDLLERPLGHFLANWDLRVVVLGSGERRYHEMLETLAASHPSRVSFTAGYDEDLAHLIEAGSDVFLMPSLYEPCGLNQMYSLAYGTLPVVRRVGGLADTVEHADPASGAGTGFVFDHYTEDGLGWALGQALTLHIDVRSWQVIQKNAMAVDNSWDRRAAEYLDRYRALTSGRQGEPTW